MNILFYLSHPAHFHLFKNLILSLDDENSVFVLIKKKDVLEDLLRQSKINYKNIMKRERGDSLFSIGLGLIMQDIKVLNFAYNNNIDVIIGTSSVVSHVGFLLRIRSIIIAEDDSASVPLLAFTGYPFASLIVTPDVCKNGKWEHKSIKYKGYHELAYLHPKYFKPDKKIVKKYLNTKKPYFIIRFSKLGAHHDKGIDGISDEIASNLVKNLLKYGTVVITSERKIKSKLNKYRLEIDPKHMHHIMAFASIYIGDSQTMAAESGVLGVPFIRFNDFVGKIGYLRDLEDNYKLGFGIKTKNVKELFYRLDSILKMKNREVLFNRRKEKMLSEKIDVVDFFKNIIISEKNND